jgi:hypothetical protein
MSLLIAMPGPQRACSSADESDQRDALPALPELTGLLTRARQLASGRDWRSGVTAAMGMSLGAGLGPATLAAQAVSGIPDAAGLCFAAPVHVVAGLSRVHLPPDGWLRIDAEESGRWLAAFNHEFGGSDLKLHAVGADWLLEAPGAAAACDAPPEELLGLPLARAPARDAAERTLRRLGAEIEIWLAGHELNRARESRGLPSFNNLWFWGGAQSADVAPLVSAPRSIMVAGEADAWLTGLAVHCSQVVVQVREWQAVPLGHEALLVLAPPRTGQSADYWHSLESRWLQPAARALRSRAIRSLRLQIGVTAWQLPDPSPLRWLRRRRPWYLKVAA